MKKLFFNVLSALITTFALTCTAMAAGTYIEGYEPDPAKPESRSHKIYLLIEDGKITKKSTIPFEVSRDIKKILEADIGRVILSSGFIDLHGHLKYNVIPLWSEAHGQFGNRFNWRGLPSYKKSVTGPLNNPALGGAADKDSLYCQTYQYAEIKALAGGVTSVQGIGQDDTCTKGVLARNVEIESDYGIDSDARSSMEIVNQDGANLFQEKVFPTVISENKSVSEVISSMLTTSGTFNSRQTQFLEGVQKYVSYLARIVTTGDIRSLIVHLSEGSSKDAYNKLEYKFAKKLGMAEKGLVIIHGVGMDEKDLADAASKDISLVWSPFSNLVLYGDTLNAELALKQNVNITLGSDWTPSGTKNLLDEVKIARRYGQSKGMKSLTDKKLFEMMTINPAKALRLADRLGRLEEGYLADIVAIRLKSRHSNPYTQIVTAQQSEIKFVMVGGELKIAQNKLAELEINADSIVTADEIQAHASCAKYAEQKVMNSPLKLSELVANMKSVFPQLDSLTSCNDENYKTVIKNLFSKEWSAQTPAKSNDAKNFDKLTEQLETLN
ncbi:MAG: amidohydrolase family protein [Bdellovibrionota bacterium]